MSIQPLQSEIRCSSLNPYEVCFRVVSGGVPLENVFVRFLPVEGYVIDDRDIAQSDSSGKVCFPYLSPHEEFEKTAVYAQVINLPLWAETIVFWDDSGSGESVIVLENNDAISKDGNIYSFRAPVGTRYFIQGRIVFGIGCFPNNRIIVSDFFPGQIEADIYGRFLFEVWGDSAVTLTYNLWIKGCSNPVTFSVEYY
ncbi:MAG: hypothetical protein V1851_01505 [Patescibacteria group bacterium]